MTKFKLIRPVGGNVLLEVIESDERSKGGIVLTSKDRETSVHGKVLGGPEYSYHPNGDIKSEPSVKQGDTVCFMKGSGTTVSEAPEGKKWLVVPEDCIYYKVES